MKNKIRFALLLIVSTLVVFASFSLAAGQNRTTGQVSFSPTSVKVWATIKISVTGLGFNPNLNSKNQGIWFAIGPAGFEGLTGSDFIVFQNDPQWFWRGSNGFWTQTGPDTWTDDFLLDDIFGTFTVYVVYGTDISTGYIFAQAPGLIVSSHFQYLNAAFNSYYSENGNAGDYVTLSGSGWTPNTPITITAKGQSNPGTSCFDNPITITVNEISSQGDFNTSVLTSTNAPTDTYNITATQGSETASYKINLQGSVAGGGGGKSGGGQPPQVAVNAAEGAAAGLIASIASTVAAIALRTREMAAAVQKGLSDASAASKNSADADAALDAARNTAAAALERERTATLPKGGSANNPPASSEVQALEQEMNLLETKAAQAQTAAETARVRSEQAEKRLKDLEMHLAAQKRYEDSVERANERSERSARHSRQWADVAAGAALIGGIIVVAAPATTGLLLVGAVFGIVSGATWLISNHIFGTAGLQPGWSE